MAFAFNPDNGLPRLIRYVEPGTLPARDLVSILDASQNLLIIDRVNFEKLNDNQQHQVLRTQKAFIEI